MSTIDQTLTAERSPFLQSFARDRLIDRLQSLPHGRLVIEDAKSLYRFGELRAAGDIDARIEIVDPSCYRDIAFGGSIGAAEAYMEGKWHSPDLVALVRLMSVNVDFLNDLDGARTPLRHWLEKLGHWLNRNTLARARQNIAAHYDLGNDFFRLFLDRELMYSAAIFDRPSMSLDEAALRKLDVIIEQLELKPSDHLLEIGTGWGGLALRAAQQSGCRVTTTTISREQYDGARTRVREAGLEDRITVLFEDYRRLEGRFDKLVSVEMIEAVGPQFYDTYFATCNRLLKDDGLMLLQAITIPDRRYEHARRSVDFIQRYIFPGGALPGHEVMLNSMRRNSDFELVGMREIGEDYALTLEHWRRRFLERLDEVRAQGFDETFVRMWEYYLCYCEGGFRERAIGATQMLLARSGWRRLG